MSTASQKTSSLDPIALLKEDHRKVQRMFKDFERLERAEDKKALASQICTELKIHTQIEEEIFYPFAAECLSEEDQELLEEAVVEHTSAKELIEKIEAAGPEAELYDAEVKVLGELVEHHIEEEENEMFVKLKKFQKEMEVAGAAMQTRKEALQAEFEASSASPAYVSHSHAGNRNRGSAAQSHARASDDAQRMSGGEGKGKPSA